MKQAFKGTIYDTEKAILLARDPPNLLSRSRHLYRTDEGVFFLYRVHETPSVGVSLGIGVTPLTVDDAILVYNTLKVRELAFSDAFPGVDFTQV
ncbi:MAG: hypothetical protein ACXV2D_05070 [Halobacteriota archaeon]